MLLSDTCNLDLSTSLTVIRFITDHRAINTVFDISVPGPKQQTRLLLKNAPWREINTRIESALEALPSEGTVQEKTDRLMSVVVEAVHSLAPKAKPSPLVMLYSKKMYVHVLCTYD